MQEFESLEEMKDYLNKRYSITILAMNDIGSRSWNLHSSDSDFDVAAVYTQPPRNYYTLNNYRQNIDRKFKVDGREVDFMSWDLKRFSELLNKSNPSAIEFLRSGEKYYTKYPNLFKRLREYVEEYFKPVAAIHHYISMAKQNYKKYIETGNDVTAKRYLYILRGVFYSRYIEENQELPSIDFKQFVYDMDGDDEEESFWRVILQCLIADKTGALENVLDLFDREIFDEFIEEQIYRDIDNEKYNVRGIEKEHINSYIRVLMDKVYGL